MLPFKGHPLLFLLWLSGEPLERSLPQLALALQTLPFLYKSQISHQAHKSQHITNNEGGYTKEYKLQEWKSRVILKI